MDIVTLSDGSLFVVDQVIEMRTVEAEDQRHYLVFESEGYVDAVPGSFAVYRNRTNGKAFQETHTGDPSFPAIMEEVDW